MTELVYKECAERVHFHLAFYEIYHEMGNKDNRRDYPTSPLCDKQICYTCMNGTGSNWKAMPFMPGFSLPPLMRSVSISQLVIFYDECFVISR